MYYHTAPACIVCIFLEQILNHVLSWRSHLGEDTKPCLCSRNEPGMLGQGSGPGVSSWRPVSTKTFLCTVWNEITRCQKPTASFLQHEAVKCAAFAKYNHRSNALRVSMETMQTDQNSNRSCWKPVVHVWRQEESRELAGQLDTEYGCFSAAASNPTLPHRDLDLKFS